MSRAGQLHRKLLRTTCRARLSRLISWKVPPRTKVTLRTRCQGTVAQHHGPPAGLQESRGRNMILDPRALAGTKQRLIPHIEVGRVLEGAKSTAEYAVPGTRW